uniref:DUF7595 domain-containing protein n=1 Tax=Leersia perrieri TaxID=77586 RepID=A0A0D9VZN9_9ORYZ
MASTTLLPDDLLIEIIARSDVASIVRCAATCSHHLRFNPILLESFEPIVSRDGLVVLKQNTFDGGRFPYRGRSCNMCVCDVITGEITPFLPATEVDKKIYPPALLSVGDIGRSVSILAFHADTAKATTIELPAGCVVRMLGCVKDIHELLLAGGTALSLVVAERELISTKRQQLRRGGVGTRQVVIARLDIDRGVRHESLYGEVIFEGFGEKSGMVLLQLKFVGLIQLNLATKEAEVLCRSSTQRFLNYVSRAYDAYTNSEAPMTLVSPEYQRYRIFGTPGTRLEPGVSVPDLVPPSPTSPAVVEAAVPGHPPPPPSPGHAVLVTPPSRRRLDGDGDGGPDPAAPRSRTARSGLPSPSPSPSRRGAAAARTQVTM